MYNQLFIIGPTHSAGFLIFDSSPSSADEFHCPLVAIHLFTRQFSRYKYALQMFWEYHEARDVPCKSSFFEVGHSSTSTPHRTCMCYNYRTKCSCSQAVGRKVENVVHVSHRVYLVLDILRSCSIDSFLDLSVGSS